MGDPTTTGELAAQAETLRLTDFDERQALDIGRWLLDRARSDNLAIAFEIWLGERLIVRVAMPGTDSTNDTYLAGKRRLVERFGHSSLYERWHYEELGTTFEAATGLTFPDYAPHGGAIPVQLIDGTQVGMVIVSGLEMRADHALVVQAIRSVQTA